MEDKKGIDWLSVVEKTFDILLCCVESLATSCENKREDVYKRYDKAQKEMTNKSNSELKKIAAGNDSIKRRAAIAEAKKRFRNK